MEIVFVAPAIVLVHFLATLEAGRHHRMVMVFRPGSDRPELWPVCSHTSNCQHCRSVLVDQVYINLGTLQVGSEVKMQGVGIDEPTAPTSAHIFPDGAGV